MIVASGKGCGCTASCSNEHFSFGIAAGQIKFGSVLPSVRSPGKLALPDEALGSMQADNKSYFFQKEGYVGRDNGQNLTFVILVWCKNNLVTSRWEDRLIL